MALPLALRTGPSGPRQSGFGTLAIARSQTHWAHCRGPNGPVLKAAMFTVLHPICILFRAQWAIVRIYVQKGRPTAAEE